MISTEKMDLAPIALAHGLELKKAGTGRLRGFCPFHKERTPSFFIFDDQKRFKCFGCGEAGDAIDFVRRLHNCSFREAVSLLGIEQKRPTPWELREKVRLRAERLEYEWRERELAWTLGKAIRLCHEALRKLTLDNFNSPEMALILTELETLQYQHDILIYGDATDRAELVHDLAGLRLFRRTLLFRKNFDFRAWLRTTLEKSEPPPVFHQEPRHGKKRIKLHVERMQSCLS